MRSALGLLAALALGACIDEDLYLTEIDSILTQFDTQFPFAAQQTFALDPEVVDITGGGGPLVLPDDFDDDMLELTRQNLVVRGWVEVAPDADPDVLVAVAKSSDEVLELTGWFPCSSIYWCFYSPIYVSVVTYQAGSIFIDMLEPDPAFVPEIGAEGVPVVWFGAIRGVLSDNDDVEARLEADFGQAFDQSPYLDLRP